VGRFMRYEANKQAGRREYASTIKSREDRKAANRAVLPGFPKEEPFQSVEEVKKYLSTSALECLLCGKLYNALGRHLVAIHDITPEAYKVRYNIPPAWAIATTSVRDQMSESQVERVERDPESAKASLESARAALAEIVAKHGKHERPSIAKQAASNENRKKSSCYREKAEWFTHACLTCGKTFTRPASGKNQKRCSKACQDESRRVKLDGVSACKRGHVWTEQSVKVGKGGRTSCRICFNLRRRDRRAEIKVGV
jgi:hypothetical protein